LFQPLNYVIILKKLKGLIILVFSGIIIIFGGIICLAAILAIIIAFVANRKR